MTTDGHSKKIQTSEPAGSDGVKNSVSRAAVVCLVLLCVLLLTAVIVLCVHFLTKSTSYAQEGQQLRAKITNLTEERDQLLTNNGILTKERDQLKSEKSELQKLSVGGWQCHQTSLYFLSSEKKNWTESRRYCTDRGTDLVIINNREEQDFVKTISAVDLVWIGLTDRDVEGSWKWVDGSSGTFVFWEDGQPNSYQGADEDCALNHSPGWADWPCTCSFKWICEKSNF
ncbi:CD209 antigen-like protein C [Puntigrus tetrazona]|uniref:CD209 antigen-like protein C n=1 Tax=Puntigrus tetrazona TaxID=1606681 RepID=UPI001C8ADFDA|nr:CD209 antigen-like protein C [Puntigrus tetrazona]